MTKIGPILNRLYIAALALSVLISLAITYDSVSTHYRAIDHLKSQLEAAQPWEHYDIERSLYYRELNSPFDHRVYLFFGFTILLALSKHLIEWIVTGKTSMKAYRLRHKREPGH